MSTRGQCRPAHQQHAQPWVLVPSLGGNALGSKAGSSLECLSSAHKTATQTKTAQVAKASPEARTLNSTKLEKVSSSGIGLGIVYPSAQFSTAQSPASCGWTAGAVSRGGYILASDLDMQAAPKKQQHELKQATRGRTRRQKGHNPAAFFFNGLGKAEELSSWVFGH